MDDQYTISSKTRKVTFALIAIGVLALVYGLVDSAVSGKRIWASVLINGFFFFGIGLCAAFFIAVQHAAEASWATVLKRVFEAVGSYMYVGWIFLVLAFSFGGHDLYHWMHQDLLDPNSPEYDEIIAGKDPYLNQPFFWARTIFYFIIWIGFLHIVRRKSMQEDLVGGTQIHFKLRKYSAIFLILFAVTSSSSAWDWIMSIDTHWYSALFGWYTFSGIWISGLIAMTLLTLYLKSQGYLQQVNENHLHDMGKWIFAISFLWTYLWFCQFMLIWYANIPEEVTYFIVRIEDYTYLYYTMVLINFTFPLIFLMDRDNKRNSTILVIVASIIFLSHWTDVYLMVTPGVMKDSGAIGILEVGMFLGFLGLFIYVVLHTLTKASLVVKNSPFLEESMHMEQ